MCRTAGDAKTRVAGKVSRARKRLRLLAREVCGVVGATHAVVLCDCGIGTDWPRHVDMGFTDTRRDQLIRCDSGFAPTFERGHPVHLVGSRATSTMGHAGNHEEPQPIL